MSSRIDAAINTLKKVAERTDTVAVGYSDGKDSRAVLDMCQRIFKRVECFFMYLVPGLESVEEGLLRAEARWGVKIHQYPHWGTQKFFRNGVFCDPWYGYDLAPELKLRDIYTLVRSDLKAGAIITGAKRSDSTWRRRFMAQTKHWDDVVNPLADWTKHDVMMYLKARNIPKPVDAGLQANGIDLVPSALIWLHDTFPRDFEILKSYFPYIEAAVKRREFFGE